MESVAGGESLSPSAGITTEVFVSSFEACTKKLDDGSGGVKLVVRVVQVCVCVRVGSYVVVSKTKSSVGGTFSTNVT